MSTLSRALFWLGLLAVAGTLSIPNFDSAMSWKEALPAALGGLVVAVLFGILAIVLVPGRLQNADERGAWRRGTMKTYGAVGLLVCLGLGGMTYYLCQEKIDHRSTSSGDPFSRELYSSGQDRVGRDLGIIAIGVGIIPLVGLILGLRKP